MQTEARLPAGPAFPLLIGWTGKMVMRPWFDAMAVRVVTSWYLPLSPGVGSRCRGGRGSGSLRGRFRG